MKILSIDTSTSRLSLAIGTEERVCAYRNHTLGRRLSRVFLNKVESFLKQQNLDFKDIDLFCVGLGPGSFTSMRVGIASLKGLAFALKKPVVGVSTLEAIALSVGEHASIYVINDARRNLLYTGKYTFLHGQLEAQREERLISIDDVLAEVSEPTIFVGSGVDLHMKELKNCSYAEKLIADEKKCFPQARFLHVLGVQKYQNQKAGDDVALLTPSYLYSQDCQVR